MMRCTLEDVVYNRTEGHLGRCDDPEAWMDGINEVFIVELFRGLSSLCLESFERLVRNEMGSIKKLDLTVLEKRSQSGKDSGTKTVDVIEDDDLALDGGGDERRKAPRCVVDGRAFVFCIGLSGAMEDEVS